MSNLHGNSIRKINVKPIEILQKAYGTSESSEDTIVKDVHQEVEKAEEKLLLIRQEQTRLLEETEKRILEEKQLWETEKESLKRTAEELGYKDGYEHGKEQSLADFQSLIAQANDVVKSAQKDYVQTIEKSDEEIIAIAIRVAEKIINQQILSQPESFQPIITAAIQVIKDKSMITIHVHPEQYEIVLQQKDELLQIMEEDCKLLVLVDESLPINGCVIEHPYGEMDVSVDTQLNEIRKALYHMLPES
ncbi:flagellar assembly protein FliH [Virgibacillus soli]|uniref:flagellar assembly protein FliH n=1 Tax=Paracerasibacillus soli TaxID=480284 RepID=UPI0035EBD8DA